ncbi:unnamed protein product [Nippostrongylus brasiliensis]|uniref:ABC transmembrane type-1 domain-containing protein n=1 Tax=Nippostrongylus brasiliensis TaxID=27835 RepID=A0A0N4Y9F8_NIPBR|nr:unnamed protein product [Nippostrongylus brasiliensis]
MVHTRKPEADFYFSLKFLGSLWTILRLIYPRIEYAAVLTVVLFVANGGCEVINYNSGTIIGDFYSALLARNESYFWTLIWKATLIYLGQTLLLATVSFITWLLYISMRKNLTTSLHNLYFRSNAYQQLNSVDSAGIDNPDQRITQDADRFCSTLSYNILPYILICPGVIGFYTYKTWITAGPFGCSIVYLYFIIGAIANRVLISPLTKWTARVEKCEGDFRYKHVSVRNNAEESAFCDAADFDKRECNRFLGILLRRQLRASLWKYPAQFLQNFFDYYGGVVSYLIQVFPIFIFNSYKDMDPSDLGKHISNNAFVFIYLINSFTRLTDLAMGMGEMAGYCQRIAQLVRETKRIHEGEVTYWNCDDFNIGVDELLMTQDLAYTSPCGEQDSALVSGLVVRRFTRSNSMFLPQRPYFPAGYLSLRQQILFPLVERDVPCIDMGRIRSRLVSSSDLPSLEFCIIVRHTFFWTRQQVACRAGISYVSVGHRKSLREYHDWELYLGGKSGWELTTDEDVKF